MTGSTTSSDFPTTSDGFKIYAGSIDAFVAQLDVTGATVPYATYLGGGGNDTGAGIALDDLGSVYITGNTASPNFPVFPSAYQPITSGGRNAFFAAIKGGASLLATNVTGASYRSIPMARGSIVSMFGSRLATRTLLAEDADLNVVGVQLPTTLAGTTIIVKDRVGAERLAPLFYVSPTQINYQIPPETPVGGALVTVIAEDGTATIGTIQVVEVAPDLFSADSTGNGPAIGNAVRVQANGIQREEPVVKFTNNKWELIPLDLGPETEQMFLVLFGTGIRFRKDPPQISATIGGVTARVDYAKNQCCFVGLDQVNLLIPRSLVGRGEVEVLLTIDGQPTLPLKIAIQ
ncbi:MAG: SBBP repeat-containing protein [Blastocatellia bacterium]|nr:SBBP repeat-containing protein [Blastocatellia bacterium]